FLIPISSILSNLRKSSVHPCPVSAGIHFFMLAEQVACQVCWIFPTSHKRSAVAAARRHLNLRNRAVFAEVNLLHAALPAIMRTVRLSVVENIPPARDLNDAAMIVAAVIHRFVRWLVCINMKIVVADDHP